MPHKNPRCPKCNGKTKHHKWLSINTRLSSIERGKEIWNRLVKCTRCGEEIPDWKARWKIHTSNKIVKGVKDE